MGFLMIDKFFKLNWARFNTKALALERVLIALYRHKRTNFCEIDLSYIHILPKLTTFLLIRFVPLSVRSI